MQRKSLMDVKTQYKQAQYIPVQVYMCMEVIICQSDRSPER